MATLSTVMTLRHMDSLPAWAQTLVRRSLKADHGSLQRMPLSKLLAYHTDLWLSKSPTSKIWGLLAGTMLLSLFGGISLFVVGDGKHIQQQPVSLCKEAVRLQNSTPVSTCNKQCRYCTCATQIASRSRVSCCRKELVGVLFP